MNLKEVKRLLLVAFIGFLVLTALIAVITVLTGTFGDVQWKILATTFTISAASICSMACAGFMEKRKRLPLGLAGIVMCILAAVLLIIGMWPEIRSDEYWQTTATCGVLAVAFAHAFLLSLPDLDKRQKWIQPVSSVSIGILALLIIAAIWVQKEIDWYLRVMAVMAILVGLETLVIPILMKLRKGDGHKKEKLTLEKIEDNLYRDSAGVTYQVKKIEPTS